MEKYNYRAVIKADIEEWLNFNPEEIKDMDIDDAADHLNDVLWSEDDITGNGGGWYDSEHKCEEYICHNLDLFFEALFEFGELDASLLEIILKNAKQETLARFIDCTIRCYLLNECIWEVLKGWYKNARPEEN